MSNRHRGSSFDDFLREDGLLEDVSRAAADRVAHRQQNERGASGTVDEALYDAIADWYATQVDQTSWAHTTIGRHLPDMTGPLEGCRILDVACGEGVFSREMAAAGAQITGVDLSSALLAMAKERAAAAEATIRYVRDDAQRLSTLGDDQFDGAICILALMDIPDLAAVFQSVARVVHADGWYVVAITHPFYDGPHASWVEHGDDVSRVTHTYLTEGYWISDYAQGVRGQVGAHHRTISTYLNTAFDAGWVLESMVEPVTRTRDGDEVSKGREIPRLLMARFRKASGS
jgi:ubiquinone/menaquinone biosynthesis C-methylase UbiE